MEEIELLYKKFKGQVVSIDLLLAVIIFLFIVAASINYWSSTLFNVRENQDRNEVQRLVLQISDILIKSQGIPDNWERDTSTLQVIGLANETNVIDTNKLENFTRLDYITVVSNFGIEGFYFYFQLKNQTKGNITSFGVPIASNSTNAASIERNVIYNNQPAYLSLIIWRD